MHTCDLLLPPYARYAALALALALVACSNENKDDKDADTGTPDATNLYQNTDCVPQSWPIDTSQHQQDRVSEMWEGHPFSYWMPDTPRAVVVMFHGVRQDGAGMSTLEHEEFYNALAEHNIGYFAYDSLGEGWLTTSSNDNADFVQAAALRDHLIESGVINGNTPIFSAGFSAGCAFNPTFANLALEAGWDYRAFACHVGSTFLTAPVPSVFYAHENDSPQDVRAAHDAQLETGFPSILFDLAEDPLQPNRFTKIPFIDQAESQAWFDELVNFGVIDVDGVRLAPNDGIKGVLNAFANTSTGQGTARATAQLQVVWRQHIWPSDRVCEELAFFEELL